MPQAQFEFQGGVTIQHVADFIHDHKLTVASFHRTSADGVVLEVHGARADLFMALAAHLGVGAGPAAITPLKALIKED